MTSFATAIKFGEKALRAVYWFLKIDMDFAGTLQPTKLQWRSLCGPNSLQSPSMIKHTYYIVDKNDTVTRKQDYNHGTRYTPSWMYGSKQVWREGPKGGIELVYKDWGSGPYLKRGSPDIKKQFMWIKLQATDPA
jgi:hypothetical protein